MGGQEVEQEVVLACVKDIIGQGIEIFRRILLAREIFSRALLVREMFR